MHSLSSAGVDNEDGGEFLQVVVVANTLSVCRVAHYLQGSNTCT